MQKRQKTSVRYQNARWTAQHGKNIFQATDKNMALLWALKRDHPEMYARVFQMLCDHTIDGQIACAPKAVIDRVIKGAQLVAKHHVMIEEWTCGRESANVRSQSHGTRYEVSRSGNVPNEWTCTCEDFRMHRLFSPVYGHMCKHCLAVLLFLAKYPQPGQNVTFDPENDPEAYRAATDGYEFEYYYRNALEFYSRQLYVNARHILQTTDVEQTISEIRTCSGARFPQIFEIPELDGERFGKLWQELYDLASNGYLPTLKTQLIDAIEHL